MLKLTGFDLNRFIYEWLNPVWDPRDRNDRWTQRKITVYFNPDRHGTGKRLPQDYIDETKRTMNKLKDNSGDFIQSITFHEDGNKTRGPPPDGEIWVFYDSKIDGVGNITYPDFDGYVNAAFLLFNPADSSVLQIEQETLDAFFGDDQDIMPDYKWLTFSFKRPASNEQYNYRIYSDREEQEGFSGSIQNT